LCITSTFLSLQAVQPLRTLSRYRGPGSADRGVAEIHHNNRLQATA
jgi:hypothetical protein